MKRIAYLFAVVASVFLVASCDEKKPAEPSKVALDKTSLTVKSEGESFTLNLTANIVGLLMTTRTT